MNASAWRLAGMGLELGMLIGGLAYLGHLADKKFDTAPWLTFTGVMLATVGGCYNLAREILKQPTPKKTPPRKPNP